MNNRNTELTFSSMFLALAVIFPQAFHMIPNMGTIILPMHIPILLCGFICGPIYGIIVGILAPILSNLAFNMPVAAKLMQMCIELGSYGLLSGILYKSVRISNFYLKIYICLLVSMIGGRLIYGLMNYFVIFKGEYILNTWISTSFVLSLPGIILQLLIVPALVRRLEKLIKASKKA